MLARRNLVLAAIDVRVAECSIKARGNVVKAIVSLEAAIPALVWAEAAVSRAQSWAVTIRVGDSPTDLLWNPATNRVYCANGRDATVTAISGESNQVLTTIQVGDYPTFLCLNGDGSKVYCTCGEENSLVVIDAVADTVIKSLTQPGLARDSSMRSLLSVASRPAPCAESCRYRAGLTESPAIRKAYLGAGAPEPRRLEESAGEDEGRSQSNRPCASRTRFGLGSRASMLETSPRGRRWWRRGRALRWRLA